jgi:hypothetical protein
MQRGRHPVKNAASQLPAPTGPPATWILVTNGLELLTANSSGEKIYESVCQIRDITISGILALLPLYVFLLVISKAWKSLSSIGAGIAQMFA